VNEAVDTATLLQVLLTKAKDDSNVDISFTELNDVMGGMGDQQFDYDVFKAAYDMDQRIQGIVKNFDKETITLVSNSDFDAPGGAGQGDGDEVSAMAKRATNLKDL